MKNFPNISGGMRKLGVVVLCAGATLSVIARFEGLSGQALADAVRREYAPREAADGGFNAPEWMSPAELDIRLVPDSWWLDGPTNDLYNIFSGPSEFSLARYDYVPAPLDSVTASGEGWEVGTAFGTNAWQPSSDRRGDLARRMMYMALMYPQQLWCSRAMTVFEDGDWPLLSDAGAEAYLGWHRSDPVDRREEAEMALVMESQGNANPFVEMPELAEYLWGDRAGMGFVPPETEKNRTVLRGTYSRSADKVIDLYSPHVPEGAVWTLDGRAATGQSIDISNVPTGLHELTFTAGDLRGKLTVNITP